LQLNSLYGRLIRTDKRVKPLLVLKDVAEFVRANRYHTDFRMFRPSPKLREQTLAE
jgi:hypothetical protein